MINISAIFMLIRLIYRQNVSKIIFAIFVFVTPTLLIIFIFFYIYFENMLNKYDELLQKSFFGYYPKISLIFSDKNQKIDKLVHKISKYLNKKDISNSIVYTYEIGHKFKLSNNDGYKIEKKGILIVYNDRYFHKKFGKHIESIFTKNMYEPISEERDIFLKSNFGKIKLNKKFDVIDVGFLNVNSAVIITMKSFRKLKIKLYSNRIDVLSDDKNEIEKIAKKATKRYQISTPTIKIYANENKFLETKKLFSNLKFLKQSMSYCLFFLIFLLFSATANAFKELKEKEFETMKHLGFSTLEMVLSFVFIEIFMISLSFLFAIFIYAYYIHSFNISNIVENNIESLRKILLSFFIIVFVHALYLKKIFRHEAFN